MLCAPMSFQTDRAVVFQGVTGGFEKNLKDLQSDLLLRSGRAEEVGITGDLGG